MARSSSVSLMTEGCIWKKIVLFAVPMFWGNLFQQLYNTADSLIVGQYLGSAALGAVSSSGHLIGLMVGFFNGLAVGAGAVVARYYGAGSDRKVHDAVHTTIAFGLAAGTVLTFIAVFMAPHILVWMGTPKEVLPESLIYFRIYFGGSLSFVMYNIFVGILQSVGDSRHPLFYLIAASVINVILDLFFIGGLGLGIGSAAAATVISQIISALLCLQHLMRSREVYRVRLRDIRFDLSMLKHIIDNGVPAGLQNCIISLANVVVQTNINHFGPLAVAGCGAYSKVEGFAFLPITCFAQSLTTFVGQNLGAGKQERAVKGARFGILCSVCLSEVVGITVFTLSPVLISAFSSDPEIIAFGTMQAETASLFYCLLAFSHCSAGVLRGAGKSKVPMCIMIFIWCFIRVSYITVAVHLIPDIHVIFWAYPLTWGLSSVVFIFYMRRADWLHGFDPEA